MNGNVWYFKSSSLLTTRPRAVPSKSLCEAGCQTKTCFQGVASDGALIVKVVPHELVGDVKTVDSLECQLVWLLSLDLTAISTLY